MAFIYLRYSDSKKPINEKDFKYLVYSDQSLDTAIPIPSEPNSVFLAHELTEMPNWNPDDELIDVIDKHGAIMVQFKKIHDHPGFTVWLNQSWEEK